MFDNKERSEDSVVLQKEKFQSLFETIPLGVTYSNTEGKITDANPAALRILGLTGKQIQGKTYFHTDWRSIYEDGSDYPENLHPSKLALKTGKPILNKVMGIINSAESECRWIKIDAFPQFKEYDTKPYQVYTLFTDITETKKTEKEVKRQSEFAFTMTKNHPAAIVACNAEGKLVLFNKTAKKWHGIDILKVPSDQWAKSYDLYNAETNMLLKTHEIPLLRAFQGEEVVNIEIIIKAKNQQPRHVLCNGSSFTDNEGNILGALVIMNDVTHQKLKEKHLKKSEQEIKKKLVLVEQSEFFLKETAKIAKIGGWYLDLTSNKVIWSDEVFKIHGLPIGKIPSLEKAMDFFIDGSKEILSNAIEESIQQVKKYDLELRFQNAQKEKLWVHTIGYPITNKQSDVVGFRGVFQDITEQKYIRSQIEKNREMYDLLANNTVDIICLQNAEGKFEYITPSLEKILGYKQLDLIDKKFEDYIHNDDLHDFLSNQVLTSENTKAYSFRVLHKEGHYVWLETLSTLVYKNGEIRYIITSARDITRWVLAKEKIQKHKKSLQKLTNEIAIIEEKEKKRIASNIHDHLSQALIISKMKINELLKGSDSNTKDGLEFIKSHISEALENSRKITYELSPPVLYQLGIIEALNWLLENLGITHKVKFQLTSSLIRVDLNEASSILLYRSIQELLNNAIKYSKASLIDVCVEKNDTEILITVTDDGVGFDLSKLDAVNNHLSGGFGLFTVQERINNLNGKFSIESKMNKGTNIKITIPFNDKY